MKARAPSSSRDERRSKLLLQLCRLNGRAQQTSFLRKHPELLKPEVVSWLSNSVREQAKVDTGRAILLAELSVTIARKLRNSTALALSLRAMGNAFYLSGRNADAVKSHESARKIFARSRNTTELARTLSATIQPLILTGQYKRALAAAKRARNIFRTEGNEWRLARLDLNVGNIFQRQGQYTEALEFYQRAHRFFLSNPEKDSEALGVAFHNVATCLLCLNDFTRALATYENARLFAAQHGMHVLVAQSEYNIALLHSFRGEYSRAVDILRSSLKNWRESKDRYHAALCYLDLSEIYLQLNRGRQAEEMAQHAAEDFQRLEMGYEAGKSLANLALAMWQQGKADSAHELFAKARAAFVDEENRVWPSRIDFYQALIFVEQGRHAEARRLCLAALKVFQKSKVLHNVALSRLLLAQICLQTRKLDSARLYCSAALRQLRTLQVPALVCQANHLLGRIHSAAGQRNEAYDCYQEARKILEALRSGLSREELKISFMKNRLEVYEDLVELCLERKPKGRSLEEAFEYIEQSKSRSLRDLMFKSGSEFRLSGGGDPDLLHKVQDLRAQINWYAHSYETEQLSNGKGSAGRLAQIQAEIRKREVDLLRAVREMPSAVAESVGLVSPKASTIEEIRASLPAGSMLVEYFQIRDRFFVLVLGPDFLQIIPLTDGPRVNDLLARLQFQLSKFRLAPEYISAFESSLLETTQLHLKDLYDELIDPIKSYLSGNHLLIVPHGILHALPFQALFDGQRYLLDSFSISYAPSATIFSLCNARSSKTSGPAIVFGVPDAAAPSVRDEALAVGRAIPDSEVYLGEKATVHVLEEKGPHSRLVHIATHGYFRQDDPMFSGIRLGDGRLSLYDLYQLKLPAELVTLSGCATGLSVVTDGDELLGLVRGLIYAGAESTLLTLWDVQDRSTAEFMTAFYGHFSENKNKASALRQAALDLRETHPHPYYWAPFVLLGKVTSE